MNFAELLCRVAKLRFTDEAQIGVRVSPIVISWDEAKQIAEAARRLLPENTFVAVACPGVEPWEDERTCVSPGEHAAERATFWRNRVRTEQGDRILYVSARRLGRAGGLQDTLVELSEQRLRAGFLEWCATPDSGCPKALAEALEESGVAELADARALADYASAVFKAVDPMAAAGLELPRLSLARDSMLASSPVARLRENVRWTRKAAAGDTRGVAKLSAGASAVHKALVEATSNESGADRARALKAVDVGALSLDELTGPQTKPRAPAKPKQPPKVAPVQPASNKATRHPTAQPAPRPQRPADGGAASRQSAPVRPERSAAQADASAANAGGAPPRTASDLTLEPDRQDEGAAVMDSGDTPGVDAAARAEATPAEPEAPSKGTSPPTAGQRRRPARAPSGAWTEVMHREELGAPPKAPEGAAALLQRSLDSPLGALTWRIMGEDPNRVLVKLPRGLGDAQPAADVPAGLAAPYRAWDSARRELISAGGGPDAVVDRFVALPYTALGAPETAGPAAAVISAARGLFDAAAGLGAQHLRWALRLDTVSIRSVSGAAVTVLTPVHPLYLEQVVARVPHAAEAARARDLQRSLLARWLERPLQCPDVWPGVDDELTAAALGPRLLAYGSTAQAVNADQIAALSAEVVLRHLAMTPATRLGLRVLVDSEQPDPVVTAVVQAISSVADANPGRTWIHASKPVSAADGLDALVSSGRLVLLPPPVGGEHPHLVLRVRHGAPSRPKKIDPVAAQFADLIRAAGCSSATAVEVGSGPVQLAQVPAEPSADDSSWDVLIAPAIQGLARRGAHVLIREARPGADLAVVTRDLRGAARELQPTLEQMGVGDTRPKVLRSLIAALASGASGVVALSSTPQRQLAALLLEHTLFETLGDDAIVATLTVADAPLWIGGTLDEWGAFSIAAARRQGGLAVCVGYGGIAGVLPPEILAARLSRAASLFEAGKGRAMAPHARGVLEELLSRGSGLVDDAERPSLAEAAPEVSFLCVLPPDHPWASGARVGSRSVKVHAAGPGLLDRLLMSAGRRRY